MRAQAVAIGDDSFLRHRIRWLRIPLADVKARRNVSAQCRATVNGRGDALRLICSQRVHRINDDRFDAAVASVFGAVLKDRIQKALGFAAAGAGRDDRAGGIRTREALKRALLVDERPEWNRKQWLAAIGRHQPTCTAGPARRRDP